MNGKFVIIDGSSLLYRAFYALPPLVSSKGVNTGAVYGLAKMLLRLIDEMKPQFMAVAFDKSRVTFRTSLFSAYKAQRKPTPPELVEQFPLARRLLESFGIMVLDLDGYEADDIIGTLAAQAEDAGCDSVIVTGDRDALQLISGRTKVLLTQKGITGTKLFDLAALRAEYNLSPAQIVELKALMGDASDNIPGVPGIGEKTAGKLLAEYGTVENIFANLEQIKGKPGEKLAANKDLAFLSRRLASIDKTVPIEFVPARFTINPDRAKAEAIAGELEFGGLKGRLAALCAAGGLPETPAKAAKSNAAEVVDSFGRASAILFGQPEGTAFVCPKITGALPRLKLEEMEVFTGGRAYLFQAEDAAWPAVLEWLADADFPKTALNAKELYQAAWKEGAPLRGIADDSAVAAYLVDPSINNFTIEALCARFCPGGADAAPAELLARLQAVLSEELDRTGLAQLYRELELPLTKVLAAMELAGITVDRRQLEAMSDELSRKIGLLQKEIFALAGEEFNLNSPKQLGALLFERLALPVQKKTKTGYSTDADVLEKLSGQHPVVDGILEFRLLNKLQSTYLEGMKPLIDQETGRVYSHFQQLATTTGRLSSTEPNLQNIPVRTETGRRIREFFVPGQGFDWLVAFDYSQVELRILAHISGDPLFIGAFWENQDIHRQTAAEVFAVPAEEVTPALRTRAKAVNFGIVYGISDFGLARDLGISRAEAGMYIEKYFGRYPGIKNYMRQAVADARKTGYATTMFNRRRYLPDINSSNFNRRSFAERTAINTPIQGSAADIIKKAMVDVARLLAEKKMKSRLLLQVHDELIFEAPDEERRLLEELVKDKMQKAADLKVPLVVDVAAGKNWAQTKG
ncbi:MAG: DNA polymerase I [Acidaminococcales bacterium]|jgi:DNA polymerase-1|nr:DNA polymerase I [Acidaminococcales bacterium]